MALVTVTDFIRETLTFQKLNARFHVLKNFINEQCVHQDETAKDIVGNKIIRRAANGTAKVAAPVEDDDIARLDTVKSVYPVGSIYINASVPTNPATLLGFGTWVQFGAGRVLVGVDTLQSEFNVLGKTGGEKGVKLTTGEIPTHTHGSAGTHTHALQLCKTGYGSEIGVRTNENTSEVLIQQGYVRSAGSHTHNAVGAGRAHYNLQPYITVYMWLRIA